MGNSTKLRHDLHQICRYKALSTARRYLILMLLLLTLYVGYYGISLVPFYLCVMLAILPSLLLDAFQGSKEPSKTLTNVIHSLGYTKKRFQGLKVTFYLTLALLLLWFVRLLKQPLVEVWLKYSPAILIISSLLIYTIGQYYYFRRFHELLMSNRIDEIH